ncbi:MAG TPA: alpha/beta fold hydrolase [bacterium]
MTHVRDEPVSDARVRAATEHWAPRFVAQGVDYNDFVRTTAGLQHWEQWLPAWIMLGDEHAALAGEAAGRGRMRSAGEAYLRAALSYHFAQFVWLLDLTARKQAARKAIECLYTAHRTLDPAAERVEIPFEGVMLAANLRRPANHAEWVGIERGRDRRSPLVLLIPGLDSAKEEFFHWEEVFLARGMATLSLDGPGQGESGELLPIRQDYEGAVSAAIDALAGREDLDLTRIGAAGVSLGGYYAPRAAAFDDRIRAVAAIGGPFDFGACWPHLPELTRATFIHHARAAGDAEGREGAARLSLRGVLPRLRQPLLVVSGRLDRIIPPEQAERVAAEAPNATLVMYPDGNHVCNNIPYKYRPLVADWLWERLCDAP